MLIKNDFLKKYLKFTLVLLLIAISYNVFVVPINLVAGGSGGLAILLHSLFGFDISFVIFLCSLSMFFLAFLVLDFEQVLSTFYATIIYPFFVKITSDITSVIVIDTDHIFVMVLFGAILVGVGQGLIFKDGLNIGGFSVLAKVIYKYTNLSLTLTNAVINATIVILGGICISFSMVLYALIFIVVLRYVSERIILGVSNNKTFKIISSKTHLIEKYIISLGHDVTLYDTIGSYDGDSRKLIMTVVPTSEFLLLRDYVKSVDKKAFIFIANTYDVGMQDNFVRKGVK